MRVYQFRHLGTGVVGWRGEYGVGAMLSTAISIPVDELALATECYAVWPVQGAASCLNKLVLLERRSSPVGGRIVRCKLSQEGIAMPVVREEKPIVTVFGASGFLGRHVVRALAKRGWRIRAVCRRPDLATHLQPLGGLGQIMPMQANLRYRASVDRAISGSDAVVNLVGILAPVGRQTYAAVQAFGARAVAEAAAAAGISRLVHVSAIGADAASGSAYARTKAAGEAAVFDVIPDAAVLRPSVIFGPEDQFINRFGELSMVSPMLPLIGGGLTRLQPVFAGDVAEAIARAVDGEVAGGRIYELGGPEVLTFRAILERLLVESGRRRRLLTIPFGLASILARLTAWMPGAPLTPDQVELLKAGSVVSAIALGEGRTLEAFGIPPTSLGAMLPEYAVRFRPHGQYDRDNAAA